MIGIALSLLSRFWPYLLAIALAAFLFVKAEHWCNGACKDARVREAVQRDRADTATEKLAELDRARIKQQEEWASATAAEEQRAKRDAESRAERFAPIRDRVASDPRLATVRVPATGVLSDSFAAAEPTQPAPKPTEAPAADSATSARELVGWGVDVLAWAAECKARVSEWEQWYGSLRRLAPESPAQP